MSHMESEVAEAILQSVEHQHNRPCLAFGDVTQVRQSHDLQATGISPWGEVGYFLEALLSYSPNTS